MEMQSTTIGKLAEAVYQRCIDLGVSFEFNCAVEKIDYFNW